MDEIGSAKVFNNAMFLRADFTHFYFMSPGYFPANSWDWFALAEKQTLNLSTIELTTCKSRDKTLVISTDMLKNVTCN